MAELQARFLPRFVETTKSRLARARSLFEGGEVETLTRELHALAGEAKMLGLFDIADPASRAEVAARAWSDGRGDDPRAACASCIDTVGRALDALLPLPGSPAGEHP